MSEFVKNLSGYSGCHIQLMNYNGKLFVRKLSGSEGYNRRLERQIIKQGNFSHPVLRAPKIYESGYIDGCFYADMEYIDGKTVAALIRDGELETAKKAIADVFTLFSAVDETECRHEHVVEKVLSMKDSLVKFDATEICQKTLSQLLDYPWETHPAVCHGDLTLENMIVKDGSVYLIDFLDAFHDCIEVDMAKMMQDLCCMWSFRHEPLTQPGIDFLQECAIQAAQLYTKITNTDDVQLKAMLQLTLLRIYPYLKDQETKVFLDKELNHLQ